MPSTPAVANELTDRTTTWCRRFKRYGSNDVDNMTVETCMLYKVLYHSVQYSCGYRPIWSERIIKCSYLTSTEIFSSYHRVVSCLIRYLTIACVSAWMPVKKIYRRVCINSTNRKFAQTHVWIESMGLFMCMSECFSVTNFHVCIHVLSIVCRVLLDNWCVWVRAQHVMF